MSENFVSFIEGSLLGDAFIDRSNRFGFNHSSKQRDYFNHKVSILRDHDLKVWEGEFTHKSSYKPGSIMLQAQSSKKHIWSPLRKRFYPNGKKIVPEDLILTPTALAYWFMDDGNANLRSYYNDPRKGRIDFEKPIVQQFRLYTDGFDDHSLEILLSQLKQLGIDAWLHARRSLQKYIIISREEAKQQMKSLIYSLIIPSMQYKINHEVSFHRERLNERTPDTSGDATV